MTQYQVQGEVWLVASYMSMTNQWSNECLSHRNLNNFQIWGFLRRTPNACTVPILNLGSGNAKICTTNLDINLPYLKTDDVAASFLHELIEYPNMASVSIGIFFVGPNQLPSFQLKFEVVEEKTWPTRCFHLIFCSAAEYWDDIMFYCKWKIKMWNIWIVSDFYRIR